MLGFQVEKVKLKLKFWSFRMETKGNNRFDFQIEMKKRE
jgi:hypothetical protein